MGTNFYATEVPTVGKLIEMEQAIANKQLKLLSYLVGNIKSYHIGKRSSGWQFLFSPHIKSRQGFWDSGRIVSPWEDTLESIKEYLSRENVSIEDEYGRKYTSEEFWKEINPCLYNDPEHINSNQYYQKTKEQEFILNDPFDYTTIEGLRFATCDDFS